MKYILGIDQSTGGTKAIVFDENGMFIKRVDRAHEQIVNDKGWVSHDPEEIYRNVLFTVKDVVEKSGIDKNNIVTVGISNQRETTVAWDKSGSAIGNAIVWQCSRASKIVEELNEYENEISTKTGLPLSPYFPAAKMAWLIENQIVDSNYLLGTIDSWLVYRLTGNKSYKTDYSNASRTQLFNIHTLKWDEKLCELFGIKTDHLPEICDSDSCFGYTDFQGYLEKEIPIHAVMGDSSAALYGQRCVKKGMTKATFGTGSSIMMNIGDNPIPSKNGLATSLAWRINGKANYVLEGNINYTGAVISWLQNDMKIIDSTEDLDYLIKAANQEDTTILVPAFSGLSAPHWKSDVKAMYYGMNRTTGKAEMVKAAVESIAYQITDVLEAMYRDSNIDIAHLRVDGGPTRNSYLMQFQSDLANVKVSIPEKEELSSIGISYLAGISVGMYNEDRVFNCINYIVFLPQMNDEKRKMKMNNWNHAVSMLLNSKQ